MNLRGQTGTRVRTALLPALSLVISIVALYVAFTAQAPAVVGRAAAAGHLQQAYTPQKYDSKYAVSPLASEMYIDLLKRSVLNYLYHCHPPELNCLSTLEDPPQGWVNALSMIGWNGLTMCEQFLKDIAANGIKGDVIETGVFRGGTSIFMRGVLNALGETGRISYVADSFAGIPEVDANKYPDDAVHAGADKVLLGGGSMEVVRDSFFQFGVYSSQNVKFLKGWFKDTLPATDFSRGLALIRLDGDLFESTWDALVHLYPHTTMNGYIIIDDYGDWVGCQLATDFYRHICGETNPLLQWEAVNTKTYLQNRKFGTWRKSTECKLTSLKQLNEEREKRQGEPGGLEGYMSKVLGKKYEAEAGP